MDFLQIIGLFFPASVPTIMEKESKNTLLVFMAYTLFINLLNLAIVSFISTYEYLVFTPVFTIKYVCLGLFNGLICCIMSKIIQKHCTIELNIEQKKRISVKNNEKKTK